MFLDCNTAGAHTIGDVACHHIDNRLYTFPKSSLSLNGVDPSLPLDFVAKLKEICPAPGLQLTTVDMDQVTPIRFDTQYYKNLQAKRSVLSSDQVLFDDRRTRPVVNLLAKNPNLFYSLFADAMVKMGDIGSLRGPFLGEIRRNCRKVNTPLAP